MTLHIWRHAGDYRTHALVPEPALSRPEIVLTLDDENDYRRLSRLADRLGSRAVAASAQEILAVVDDDPALIRVRDVPEGLS